MFRLARASKSLKNESISTGQNYKPKLGHKYRGKAQRYNPENVFWKGEKTTGYGHDKKAWGKVDQIPKGRNKMQTDWRTTSPMVRQKSSENQEIWQRGVEGNNSDLKLQETIAKNHVGGFPKTLSKEYANGVDNKVPQQTAAYILHNRHQHQFEAAGLDQFSCMFQIPVITDSVPEKISEILPEFEKIAEQESSEYLKIAQKDRLFYQDPTIINKLKPVTTFMDESKRPWNYQSRDLGYLARHEGKSTAQEMSYTVWDWELDEPNWRFYGGNMIRNFLHKATFDITKHHQDFDIGLRSEHQNQLISCLLPSGQKFPPKISIEMNTRWAFQDFAKFRGRVHSKISKDSVSIPSISPIDPFADANISNYYRGPVTSPPNLTLVDGAIILVDHIEPSHFYHTIDWEARAAQMLTALYGHDQAYRGNLKHFYSEKDGNVTPKDAFEREDSYRDPVFPQDSNCLSHIGIISSAQEYLFCVLQTSEDKNESPVAFVDGPYQIYERLENRNWRAGESYCSEWDEEGIARLLAYWSL